MTEERANESSNVEFQQAIIEVARHGRGKKANEIVQMLRAAFARRRLPSPPGPWMESVASEAARGKPYVVDVPTAKAMGSTLDAPGAYAQDAPARRGEPGEAADVAGASGGSHGSRTRQVPDPGYGPGLVRGIVAGAIALGSVACVVIVIRAARRRSQLSSPVSAADGIPITAF